MVKNLQRLSGEARTAVRVQAQAVLRRLDEL
jgi:hypothetical protein